MANFKVLNLRGLAQINILKSQQQIADLRSPMLTTEYCGWSYF